MNAHTRRLAAASTAANSAVRRRGGAPTAAFALGPFRGANESSARSGGRSANGAPKLIRRLPEQTAQYAPRI